MTRTSLPKSDEIIIVSDMSAKDTMMTWACYIKFGDEDHKMVAAFKHKHQQSHGELLAMINAIIVADKLFNLADRRVRIYCDNISVVKVPLRRDGQPRKRGVDQHRIIQQHLNPYLEKTAGHEIIWIKGHGKSDCESEIEQMHRWCDVNSRALCRKLYRLQKTKLRKLQKKLHQKQEENELCNFRISDKLFLRHSGWTGSGSVYFAEEEGYTMQVADQKLCEQLYAVSGWDDNELVWFEALKFSDKPSVWEAVQKDSEGEVGLPAYTLDFLIRKLPAEIILTKYIDGNRDERYQVTHHDPNKFFNISTDTPENTLAQLALALFKANILKPDGRAE